MKKPHIVKKWASAGDRPPQQPGLPEHLFDLGGDARAEVVLAAVLVAGLLAGADQVRQPQHALGGEHQHERRQSKPDDEPDQHLGFHRVPPGFLSYSRVTYRMLLASNFRSGPASPAHSCILRGNAATKAALTTPWGRSWSLRCPWRRPCFRCRRFRRFRCPCRRLPGAGSAAHAGAGARRSGSPVAGSGIDRRRLRRCRRWVGGVGGGVGSVVGGVGRRRRHRRRRRVVRHRRLRTRLLRRAIGPRWGLLHDDGGHLGGLRRRGSWESGRRRRRGGGGRGGRRFDRSGGGVAEQGDAEHGRSDGRGDRRQTEQHKRATPRRLCVLPFLVAEVHLGAGVGHVAVGQYVLAGVVFGPGQADEGSAVAIVAVVAAAAGAVGVSAVAVSTTRLR